jgi:phosphoribosylformimino-5-aminoimidazole carboxamide ribotide isomerase
MFNLLIIPSIDIQNGKTVRVVQGIPEIDTKDYDNDPVEMAMIWRAENAKCIHVVDFDAAWDNSVKNLSVIEKICSSVIIPVQLGGGIRSVDAAKRVFDLGIYRVVVGTIAVEHPEIFKQMLELFGPKKIAASFDVIEGEIVIDDRRKKTGIKAVDLAVRLADMGVERFSITDINSSGMLQGPNINLSLSVAQSSGKKVTLSGGVRDKNDLLEISKYTDHGIDSVIIGRALYENRFPCQRLWRKAEHGIFN